MKSLTIAYKILVALLAATVVVLTAWGAYHQFSPVPFWDMWNGFLGFYQQINQGNNSAWWASHNEHRIILTRIIFWLDFKLFNGIQPPLILVNFLLMGAAFWAFHSYLRRIETSANRLAIFGVNCLILALCFFWSQSENINWGFQSQFYLAQLVPLLALYWYFVSILDHRPRYFVLATAAGILSVGTMANGIIILPIMVLYGLVQKQPIWKLALHAMLTAILAFLYFSKSSNSSGDHAGLVHTFLAQPSEFIQYTLRYLGSPFFYLLGETQWGIGAAMAAGAGLIFLSAALTLKYLVSPNKRELELSLLCFILYIGGTAIGTAAGRLDLGLGQAFSHRYTTPAIMAWCALIVLLCNFTTKRFANRLAQALSILALIALLPFQASSLQDNAAERLNRMVAALALDMRIEDASQLQNVYPRADHVMSISQWAADKQVSIFGQAPIKDAKQTLGQVVKPLTDDTCALRLSNISVKEVNNEYVKIFGTIRTEESFSSNDRLIFTDSEQKIVGTAIAQRPDFSGYLKRSALGAPLSAMTAEGLHCSTQLYFPRLYFSTFAYSDSDLDDVASAPVEADNIWAHGSDSWHSAINGLKIYGSWAASDADTGKISFELKKGDAILYRSGPTDKRQKITIVGMGAANIPTTLEWAKFKFDAPDLPEHFTVILSDDGDGWGEWSAVALKAAK